MQSVKTLSIVLSFLHFGGPSQFHSCPLPGPTTGPPTTPVPNSTPVPKSTTAYPAANLTPAPPPSTAATLSVW